MRNKTPTYLRGIGLSAAFFPDMHLWNSNGIAPDSRQRVTPKLQKAHHRLSLPVSSGPDSPMAPAALHDPSTFVFVPTLEAAFASIRAELQHLESSQFQDSPDSLTTVADGYDETGWKWFPLFGSSPECAANRARCPATTAALECIPGLQNAGFSRFLPGTHLYPHCGEMQGVLRCHLPVLVPEGEVGMRFGQHVVQWQEGRCIVFDDTFEHEAWNHTAQDRVVLLATFAR